MQSAPSLAVASHFKNLLHGVSLVGGLIALQACVIQECMCLAIYPSKCTNISTVEPEKSSRTSTPQLKMPNSPAAGVSVVD